MGRRGIEWGGAEDAAINRIDAARRPPDADEPYTGRRPSDESEPKIGRYEGSRMEPSHRMPEVRKQSEAHGGMQSGGGSFGQGGRVARRRRAGK